jgi:HAD superfamily hydrolase (TIGR01509 family)
MAKYCAIFDLDGTLVDSEMLNNQAFTELLPDLKESIGDLVVRYRGKKLAHILIDIEGRLGRALPPDFEQRYRARVMELFASKLEPTPGTMAMLEQNAFPRCVASSAPMGKIQQALNVSGLAKYFSGRIFSSYEIGSWKPEPTLFLHASEQMGYLPQQCVVVEDSAVGVEAALAAGMRVLYYAPDEATEDRRADRIVRHMSEVPRLLAEVSIGHYASRGI